MAKRIVQLDGVRALAIGAVFLHHSLHVKMLWAGVDLFFVLSGFLITGILLGQPKDNLGRYFSHFYERRARRILPPYLVFLAIVSAFFGIAWIHHWYRYFFLMNLLLVLPTPDTPPPMAVLWSLSVEEQFYMVWPFVIYFLSETAVAWTAGALILIAPLLRWFCTPLFALHWAIYSLTPFRMDLLAVGALLAVAWRRYRPAIERYGAFGLMLSAFAAALLYVLSRSPQFTTYANTQVGNVWIYECNLMATTGVILWALSGRWTSPLSWAPIVWLGRISYSIYLIHMLTILLIDRFVHNEREVAVLAALASIGYASLSWRFMEQPILTWKSHAAERRQMPEPEATSKAVS